MVQLRVHDVRGGSRHRWHGALAARWRPGLKANKTPRIAGDPTLQRELSEHAAIINLLVDGRIGGTNNATDAAPTGGDYTNGDFVRNNDVAELGTPGSMYVILGWVNVLAGSPGTFVECRVLTGN